MSLIHKFKSIIQPKKTVKEQFEQIKTYDDLHDDLQKSFVPFESDASGVGAAGLGMMICRALDINTTDAFSVDVVFDFTSFGEMCLSAKVGKYKRDENYKLTSEVEYRIYYFKGCNMRQLILDICEACNMDTKRLTGFKISCPGIHEVATVSVTSNVVPHQEKLHEALSKFYKY